MEYIDNKIAELKNNFPKHINFLDNYFIKNKYIYFQNDNLNYSLIPIDARSNSYLENYNKIIKEYFGNKHETNWLNFINFIKSQSIKSLEKLIINANANVRYKEKYTKFGVENSTKKKKLIKIKNG